MAAGDLYALCREFLDACAEALEDAGNGIDRVFVSPGVPAWDCCPQLTVHAGGPSQADTAPLAPPLQPGHRTQQRVEVPLIQMTATVLRCVPGLPEDPTIAPDPAGQEAAAVEVLADVWTIWNHLRTLKREDQLWGPREREAFFDPAAALVTAGQCAGWQIPVRVQLGGYRTVT